MTASPYLGRCKDCDYALFTAAEDVREADNAVAGGPAVNIGNGQVMGRCPSRHRWFNLKRIDGTYSEVHECDSRCLNARGWKCTCSCGGMNHGRGHVANVVQAPSVAPKATQVDTLVQETHYVPVPVASPQEPSTEAPVGYSPIVPPRDVWIGEVGKWITGTAIVERVAEYNVPAGSIARPYTFLTNKGAEIVWWCPMSVDPAFDEGERVTFRAKVKAHNEHPRFGKSTVVTYLERTA